MYYQMFLVEWVGMFPLDMLRYDGCFPACQEAVSTIYDNLTEHLPGPHCAKMARLVRYKKDVPCTARWQSFGARVSEIETR